MFCYRRTLRIVYALAAGIPIVTEDWVFASLTASTWVDVQPFLHPRFAPASKGPLSEGLKAVRVWVGPSSDPSPDHVQALLEAFAATTPTKDICAADVVVFGKLARCVFICVSE